jgi:hypothetical protein
MAPWSSIVTCTVLSLLLSQTLYGQETEENIIPEEGSFGLGWLDQGQSIASNSVNSFAKTVDRFFGEPRSDLEAAYSSLRISAEYLWRQNNSSDTSVHLRGKIHLPVANERLSLLFSEDEGEGTDFYDQLDIENPEQESINTNLQFNIFDKVRNRLDFRLGLRSSLRAKASIRYRYELPSGNDMQHRFANTLYFIDGDGFGSLARYEIDKALSNTSLIRWGTDFRVEENVSGARWGSQLSFSRQVSDQTALLYYFGINGITSPGFITDYGLGFRFRKNIGRPWLFAELEPGHSWTKLTEHSSRQGNFYLFLRLEAAIGRI